MSNMANRVGSVNKELALYLEGVANKLNYFVKDDSNLMIKGSTGEETADRINSVLIKLKNMTPDDALIYYGTADKKIFTFPHVDLNPDFDPIMQSADKSIEKQNQAVKDTQNAFGEFENFINSISEMINNINSLMNSMEKEKNEIVQSMENISGISEETAASTEEVSASTEEQLSAVEELKESAKNLEEVALKLDEAVKIFKI
ncbi:hypothetical protein [Thermoanaerobacter sp. A7A]|nr:hypothetical protein [Thermoanaerobacter sp. A7A]